MAQSLFRQHRIAIIFAVFTGLFVGGVLTFGERNMPGFAGIYKQTVDDQLYYLARGRDVIDGHPLLANPYLAEHKGASSMQVWLPDALLAVPLGAMGVPVEQGYLAYAFLFSAFLFFLTYACVFLLARSRALGILAACFLHLGIFEFALARIPSPQFNFIFFEFFLLALLLYLQSGRRRYLLAAAASFGLLFYLYPYFWTFIAAVLGIFLALGYFLRADMRLRGVLAVFLGGFALAAQYFWSLLQASRLSSYKETVERIGLIYTHFPSGYVIVALAGLALAGLAYAFRTRVIGADATVLLLASGTIAAAVSVNQHVVTGQNLEFSSHYLLPSLYWITLTAAYLIARFLAAYRPQVSRKVAFGILGAVVAAVVLSESLSFARVAFAYTPADVSVQRYAPVFAWLSANTKNDDVVFADDRMSYYIPAYTSDNVYSSGYAILFFLSNKEAEERFIANHYWDAFTPEYIAANERSIFGAQYLDEYAHNQSKNKLRRLLRLPLAAYERIPASAIERVMAEAEAMQALPFESALKRYRADYIVWDTSVEPSWKLDRYPFLKKQYESGGIIVYKIS